jgi:hypothetical protein
MKITYDRDRSGPTSENRATSLTLFGSRRIFLIFSLFFALLIYGSFLNRHNNPIISSIAIFFFIFFFYCSAHLLVTNGYRLEINDQGLALTFFGRTQTILWVDVKTIRVGWVAADGASIPFNKRLFVYFRKDGCDRSLTIWPLFFNVSAKELVRFMLPYCSKYPKLVETLCADSEDGVTL